MRSMWKGSISFGLVNIPVRMYAAVEDKEVRFNQLHAVCHTPIKYQKICPNCEKVVEQDEIVRGYEIQKNEYVVITDEEWEHFQGTLSRTVDILRFVDLRDIDPVYFDRSYYLEPAETGAKAYRLLVAAMQQAGKIGIASITVRTKQALAAVRVYEGALALETMHYPDEIRSITRLDIPETAVVEKELAMAVSLINSLTEPFRPEEYVNERRRGLLELIESKAAGETHVVTTPAAQNQAVADLMAALEASLKAVRT
ncbi:MAG: Ku protein [Firmicutes bacterium]|nr:Ku protein [Bacillota bacterium]